MERLNARFKWPEATGEAKYVADRQYPGLLEGRFYRSSCARGKITAVHLPPLPEGYHVFSAADVPGENQVPIVTSDWPAFADTEVRYIGQVILLLVGPDPVLLEQLLSQISVDYHPLTPAFTLSQSKAALDGAISFNAFAPQADGVPNLYDDHVVTKGDVDTALQRAHHVIEETLTTGYQEHLYIETQGCVGYVQDGKVVIEGSMQCPWYVHHCARTVLGHDNVRVIQCPTGGGFGGKEDYPSILAGPLAVAVEKLQQPVRVLLERREDICASSKRHPVEFRYRTGVDADGRIIAMDIEFDLNSGAYFSLSGIVLQRAITTGTNVYDIPNVRISGKAWATNTVPTGAFRGFGSPQTCFCIETHMSHVAKQLGRDPLTFKQAHLLKSDSVSLTGAPIFGELVLENMLTRVLQASDYHAKAAQFAKEGEVDGKRRGIGLAFFQHGCGFAGDLEDTLVKARVKLVKDSDDQVTICVSNTDIGQGLSLTFREIVASTLKTDIDNVHIAVPDTDWVPDSGPTVASRSIVIVGYILERAALKLKDRWHAREHQEVEEVYKKPSYHVWDQTCYQGNAYQSTSYGINVVEVSLDTASCEARITGVWSAFDVGHAIDAQIFRGQIDGGTVQALGFGAMEKLELTADGTFAQQSMADYVIPTALDVPYIHSELVENPYPYGPQGAKGGGELTHNGGAPAFVSAVEAACGLHFNALPVTPERISAAMYHSEGETVGHNGGGKYGH